MNDGTTAGTPAVGTLRAGKDPDHIEALVDAISTTSGPVDLVGAGGGFTGALLVALQRRLRRPLVIVTPDEARANVVAESMGFFAGRRDGAEPIALLPMLDHIPFQGVSPSRLGVMERVATLFRIVWGLQLDALVVAAPALLDRVIGRAALETHAAFLKQGDILDRDQLIGWLTVCGYHRVPAAEDPGSFAVRGGIIDVYSPLYDAPVRIELWGDEIDSLKAYDPETQMSLRGVESLALGPARDIVFTRSAVERAKTSLRALADALDVPSSRMRALEEDLKAGILGVGMEELLPAFHERLETVFDVAGDEFVWVVDDPEGCERSMRARWDDVSARADRRLAEAGALSFDAESLYLPGDEAVQLLSRRAVLRLAPFERADGDAAHTLRVDVQDNRDVREAITRAARDGEEHVLASLVERIRQWRDAGMAVAGCARTVGGVERLRGLLAHYQLAVETHDDPFHLDARAALARDGAELHLFVGEPGEGFRSRGLGLVLLDETEILGRPAKKRRRRRRVPAELALKSWQDLNEGDYVVHLTHGIARYSGLTKSRVGAVEADFLVLEYADGNKLFVPVDRLHLVTKHLSADAAAPKLDKLGGAGWQRVTRRVRKAVRDIADKLLVLYAKRAARPGHAFAGPDEYDQRFWASFPFEETPDQARAIDDALADLQRPRPMDRLVCGDVGFGKTEVALRAAFRVVLSGKQVAVLVPTQVLAEQHRATFNSRLEEFAISVQSLSRMRSSKEQRDILRRVQQGSVDILIGTHRLLSKDVVFKDLGLLVIDEEHRFGVAQKERLKRYRETVDVLTLTATPIPRTLHLSMMGLRDISLIQTPPVDRLPVRTFVAQPTEELIVEVVRRELARGGQVFYVHNRVTDIERHAELIRRLVPEARVIVGHGQMKAGQLENVMLRFVAGEANVLVCTTIVESGVDIPNANTMLINRADRFGLAQLYQLRGRVGRSAERAFCYLLIPSPKNLDGDAQRRIAAIQRFSELGSGFSIASYDLDIRGTGEILGAEQSGNINAVGYEAFMEMLRAAVTEVSAEARGETPPPNIDPELKIAIEARIPETWLPDTTLRLRLYKELAGAADLDSLLSVQQAAIDRYGKPPAAVSNLVGLMAVKLQARELGIASVGFSRSQLTLQLTRHGPLSAETVASMLVALSGRYTTTPDLLLTRPVGAAEWRAGLETVRESLREIRNFVSSSRP